MIELDTHLVLTDEIALAIEAWIPRWEASHPRGGSMYAPSALVHLHERSGIGVRRIYSILRREYPHTTLRIADALLAAADRNDLLCTLTVRSRSDVSAERAAARAAA